MRSIAEAVADVSEEEATSGLGVEEGLSIP